jgi:hypothetical protein
MDDVFKIDDSEIRAKLAKLKALNGKNLSALAWKAGKEATFAMMKATPVAKSFKAFQLTHKGEGGKRGKPVLNRSGEMIFVKDPRKSDKSMKGLREGYESANTGRRASKIPKGKRYLLSAWYTARMGFRIKTGKVKAGAQAQGEFYSGISADRAELVFSNTVPYSGNVDQRKNISAAAVRGINAWLDKAIDEIEQAVK